MNIFTQGTVSMWIEYHRDGMHVVSEIDDDELGFKSEVHYILSHDAVSKMYTIISEKEFTDLCRKGWTSGMEDFLNSHEIPYRRVSAW